MKYPFLYINHYMIEVEFLIKEDSVDKLELFMNIGRWG